VPLFRSACGLQLLVCRAVRLMVYRYMALGLGGVLTYATGVYFSMLYLKATAGACLRCVPGVPTSLRPALWEISRPPPS
jgi:hypothetical protein